MRLLTGAVLCVGALWLCSTLYLLLRRHLYKFRPSWDLSWYDLGLYGTYLTQSYFSFNLKSPRVSMV